MSVTLLRGQHVGFVVMSVTLLTCGIRCHVGDTF